LLRLVANRLEEEKREVVISMGDRWIEDFEQERKQTDDSRFMDDVWLVREKSAEKGGDWNWVVRKVPHALRDPGAGDRNPCLSIGSRLDGSLI
jgi:hypothetical protein